MDHETQRERLFLLMQKHNLTQVKTAKILGVNERTVRSWLQPEHEARHRTMPPAVWYMLNAELEKLEKKEAKK